MDTPYNMWIHVTNQIQTYRKVAPMKNHRRDIYTSTLRYYRNAFTDADKQMAINVFLGVFVPKEGEANVWELSTDYYLHHRTAREPQSPKLFKSPTKWWKDELISSLPLPQYEGQVIANTEDDPKEEEPTPPAVPHINNDTTDRDSFDEIYKTYELTDFDRLLSTSVVRTGDNVVSLDSEGGAIQGNPFVVRDKMKKKFQDGC
ncbi:PREDICTED: polyphosphoinositide phosphatase-like isoform X3 [Amphimedon queenslandica]|uniref:Uncharacterized protein n=1 Tax=Amphimedon queenslandica TaxID=400682 RepID=A0AAN0JT01_AMPQE|nr:PREDICTED: polyphosphoinositide phosphatase-like isoform X3 [Amphimedon queenslandica]|eukprot:XP_019860170.1 PREDICTED: polyphosphoinositide phosphatase-like isoform X3 [Amphimedon queenslandica]